MDILKLEEKEGYVIRERGRTCITLPKDYAILYLKYTNKGHFEIEADELVGLKMILSTGVKKQSDFNYYAEKGAEMLFEVCPKFYRGKIDYNKVLKYSNGLENFLEDTELINSSDELIGNLAQEIRNQLPKEQRENPCFLINKTLHWITDNIEYVILPKKLLKFIGNVIDDLPKEEKTNTYKVLNHCFNLKEDLLKAITSGFKLPLSLQEAGGYEIAKELMKRVTDVSDGFQWFWGYDRSAKRTFNEKSGRCDGISNLFVALCRNLGIPSKGINGWYGVGHAWATCYIHPYGWKEIEPRGESEDFSFIHAYPVFFDYLDLPECLVFDKSVYSTTNLGRAIELLEKNKKEYPKGLEFLQNLKKELESLHILKE